MLLLLPTATPQSLLLFHLFLREAAFLPPPLHSLMTCFPLCNKFFFFCSHALFIKSWCRFFKKNPHILFFPAPTVQSPAVWVGVWMTFRWPPLSRNPQFLSLPALHRSNPPLKFLQPDSLMQADCVYQEVGAIYPPTERHEQTHKAGANLIFF